jgi:hypothetical protein
MTILEQAYCGQAGDFMTVRHLTIRGTNLAIGRKLGELAIERYGRTVAQLAADPAFVRARRIYMQHQFPLHWERIKGVAAAYLRRSGGRSIRPDRARLPQRYTSARVRLFGYLLSAGNDGNEWWVFESKL